MAPRLASHYPAPRTTGSLPPIFTVRTLGLPLAAGVGATACWATAWHDAGWAFAGVSAVALMQLVAPAVRQRSLTGRGWWAEVQFAAPFVLFFAPYVLWAALFPPSFALEPLWSVVALAVAAGVRLTELSRLRLGFDRQMLELMPPLRQSTLALRAYQTLAAAIMQELFYRGALFVLLAPTLKWGVVPVCAALFVAEHWSNRWAAAVFTRAYMMRIAILATGLGVVAYASDSVVPAIVGHIAYNLVTVFQGARHRLVNPWTPAGDVAR